MNGSWEFSLNELKINFERIDLREHSLHTVYRNSFVIFIAEFGVLQLIRGVMIRGND